MINLHVNGTLRVSGAITVVIQLNAQPQTSAHRTSNKRPPEWPKMLKAPNRE